MGRLAPLLSGGFGSGEEILFQFDGIHGQGDIGGAIGDPVAGIGGQEERHAHIDGGGVGSVLDAGGGHDASGIVRDPVVSLVDIIAGQGRWMRP